MHSHGMNIIRNVCTNAASNICMNIASYICINLASDPCSNVAFNTCMNRASSTGTWMEPIARLRNMHSYSIEYYVNVTFRKCITIASNTCIHIP